MTRGAREAAFLAGLSVLGGGEEAKAVPPPGEEEVKISTTSGKVLGAEPIVPPPIATETNPIVTGKVSGAEPVPGLSKVPELEPSLPEINAVSVPGVKRMTQVAGLKEPGWDQKSDVGVLKRAERVTGLRPLTASDEIEGRKGGEAREAGPPVELGKTPLGQEFLAQLERMNLSAEKKAEYMAEWNEMLEKQWDKFKEKRFRSVSGGGAKMNAFLDQLVVDPLFQNVENFLASYLPPELKKYKITLLALFTFESDFDPDKISPVGAVGISQQMLHKKKKSGSKRHRRETRQKMVFDPFNPLESARMGEKEFGDKLKHTGGFLWKALMAYNGGMGAFRRQEEKIRSRNPKLESSELSYLDYLKYIPRRGVSYAAGVSIFNAGLIAAMERRPKNLTGPAFAPQKPLIKSTRIDSPSKIKPRKSRQHPHPKSHSQSHLESRQHSLSKSHPQSRSRHRGIRGR